MANQAAQLDGQLWFGVSTVCGSLRLNPLNEYRHEGLEVRVRDVFLKL